MTSPWERLREAALAVACYDVPHGRPGLAALIEDMQAALAALPATPPEQPSSDAERERAIEEWRASATSDPCPPPAVFRRQPKEREEPYPAGYWLSASEIDEAVALMRRR